LRFFPENGNALVFAMQKLFPSGDGGNCVWRAYYCCGGTLEKVPDIAGNGMLSPVLEYPVPEKDPDIVSPE
jgi:hypothetical protein